MLRIEIEAPSKLHEFVISEIESKLQSQIKSQIQYAGDGVVFDFYGNLSDLLHLRTITAAYIRLEFDIPRPKALLGHEHFHRILRTISLAETLHAEKVFQTFMISAAGSQTTVMQRIKDSIETATGLVAAEPGDLLVRIKRDKHRWVVLVRLTPRPLANRPWRVCDMEGALNGPVAYILNLLTNPSPDDIVCNLMCGSGSILVERALLVPYRHLIGIDYEYKALQCAEKNIQAVKDHRSVSLIYGNVTELPLPDESIDVLLADLPFGSLVGSHEENIRTYPKVLKEAARIATNSARFVLLTHEIRLIARSLENSNHWRLIREIPISLRGVNPRIYVLQKSNQIV